MPFDTALSGIRAASTDLSVTGNNIANASTTGFKSSRTEFGDVYATSVLGSGANAVGNGVQVLDVAQSFTQGNVAFTENSLDLAVNGNGFFVLSQGGSTSYTRAGAFGLDDEGFVVNSATARLQGFPADPQGNIGGIAGDMLIETSNLEPRRTTSVELDVNLDAAQLVLQRAGRQLTTEGVDVGVAQVGLHTATTTTLNSTAFTLPLANDFSTTPLDFDVTLTGQGGNVGTLSISLDSVAGVPPSVTTFNDVRSLVSVINSQISTPTSPQTAVDIVASAIDLGGGNFQVRISAIDEGLTSTIDISNNTANSAQIGLTPALTSVSGVPQVTNGYRQQAIDIINPDAETVTYNTSAGATAAATAAELNALQGVSATATTTATLSNYNNSAGNMSVSVNGINLTSTSFEELEAEVNALTRTSLPGISALFDPVGNNLVLSSSGGDDIQIDIDSSDDGDSLTVQGNLNAAPVNLEADPLGNGVSVSASDASENSAVVGGIVNIVLEEGYDISPQTAGGLFQPLTPTEFTDVVINEFDPNDPASYNSATSMTVYDSLGISHVMTEYFVRQAYDPADPTSSPNHWQMHVQIDGQDVGDPDTGSIPISTEPTLATYNIFFNDDGTLNDQLTDNILISNWVPVDENGEPNSAAGPQNVLAGGSLPVPEPPTSSNFFIDLSGTSQFGSSFSVEDLDQDGFSTGRLSGLNIDDDGVVFARFTNGESRILAQVALADFPNQEGLQPAGNSAWFENSDSGEPRIAGANTGSLGVVQSGALEESNVDLSAELVNLIIAQRNFQANAKTIETADTVTQTIINLR